MSNNLVIVVNNPKPNREQRRANAQIGAQPARNNPAEHSKLCALKQASD
jgi:hypothetical protein